MTGRIGVRTSSRSSTSTTAPAVVGRALALLLAAASPASLSQQRANPVPAPNRATGELHAYSRHIGDANTLYRQALWHVISHPDSEKTIDGKDVSERFDLTGDGKPNLVVSYRVLDESEIMELRATGYSAELELGCPCRLNAIGFFPGDAGKHRFIQRDEEGLWEFVARDPTD